MDLANQHTNLPKQKMDAIHDIGSACWDELASLICPKPIDKNVHYSEEGQYTKEIGFVINGVLRLYYLNEKGAEWNKHFITPSDFFAASIDPDQKSVTNIQALTKVEYLSIPYHQFNALSEKYRQLGTFMQKLTNQYLASKQEREIILLSEDATQKYLKFREKFPDLEQKIPHYHIASYLGVTPTQLSRVRRKI